MEQLTPNLIVDDIELCLPFYERLGFVKTVEVPHEDRLGFVILEHGDVQLMLQSRASLEKDVPPLVEHGYRSVLYVKTADLEPIRRALVGVDQVVPERTTFYGAREIIVRDPAGNAVFFSAHG